MMRLVITAVLGLSLFSTTSPATAAENCLPEGATWPESWTTSFPAHRVIGNLYAVGGEDLASFLITTSDGHILINTGLEDSLSDIRRNIDSLGYRLEDVRILLTTQAHFDHTAALAEIKRSTGAEMWATAPDAPILEDGGKSDPHFGNCSEFRFPPIAIDKVLNDGDVITLGDMSITTHLHPGHTEGSASYSFTHSEAGKTYNVLVANMGTINPGKRLTSDPTYPGVADDFRHTFSSQRNLAVDVWVASHASQYGRDEKFKPGQPYSPDTFVDGEGFHREVQRLEMAYRIYVGNERSGADDPP